MPSKDAPTANSDSWSLTPIEVDALLRQSDSECVLVDCRTQEEWDTGHVEGAVLVPMLELGQHMDWLRSNEDKPIIVMCRSGKRSCTVATVLRAEGFANVKFMAGGIMRWISDVDPSIAV